VVYKACGNSRAGLARRARGAARVAARAHRLPAGGCGHARAVGDRLDAAERAHGLRGLPGRVPEPALGPRLQARRDPCVRLCQGRRACPGSQACAPGVRLARRAPWPRPTRGRLCAPPGTWRAGARCECARAMIVVQCCGGRPCNSLGCGAVLLGVTLAVAAQAVIWHARVCQVCQPVALTQAM